MQNLTQRQQEVFELIKRHIAETGMPPTRADIAHELGFRSANAAEEHLKALAKKGMIEILAGTSRGIRILHNEEEGLPVVGRVAAGNPLLAVENIEERCDISPDFFYPAADYLLRVKGESMKNIGILDGDLLAVHRTPEARNGDIVVARLDEEVTVKRLKKNRSKYQITLLAENEDFEPIEVDLRDQAFAIEGISVGVIRR